PTEKAHRRISASGRSVKMNIACTGCRRKLWSSRLFFMRTVSKAAGCIPLLVALGVALTGCSSPSAAGDVDDEVIYSESTRGGDNDARSSDDGAGEDSGDSGSGDGVQMLPFEEDGPAYEEWELDGRKGIQFSGVPNGWPEALSLPASGELLTSDRVMESDGI